MSLIFASTNKNKIREVKNFFTPLNIEIQSMADIGIDIEIIEDANTFEGNALKKANEFFSLVHKPVLADDSGVCIDAIGGKPGIYSHRYLGDDIDTGLIKLLNELKDVPFEKRTASQVSAMVLKTENCEVVVKGICNGYITTDFVGNKGFAYDKLFFIPELNKTFGELSEEEKLAISHRGNALRKLCEVIKNEQISL